MAMDVTDNSFEEEVLNNKIPVLVDFWAEWCGPCKMLAPTIDELSKSLQGKVKILKMNIDDNPDTPTKFGVRSIPTMMIFKDGKQLASRVGALPKSSIEEWINSNITD